MIFIVVAVLYFNVLFFAALIGCYLLYRWAGGKKGLIAWLHKIA